MTVKATTNSQLFLGNGNTGPFTWTWRFLSNSHIVVVKTSEGVETTLVEGVGFTLAGAQGYQGGTLILTDVLAVGETLYVYRRTPATQDVDLRNQGDFFPESYEDAIDALTMMIQDGVLSFAQAMAALDARMTVIEGRGYTVVLEQSAVGAAVTTEVDTSLGDVPVVLPAEGEVVLVKKGADANLVLPEVSVEGQTINDGLGAPLEVDGQYVRLTLLGTNWRITG